jgi:hypothetical protein
MKWMHHYGQKLDDRERYLVRRLIDIHANLVQYERDGRWSSDFVAGMRLGIAQLAGSLSQKSFFRDLTAVAERWYRIYCREDRIWHAGKSLTSVHSGRAYGELLRTELERRHPKIKFIVEIHPASPEGHRIVPMRIDMSDNMPNSEALFNDVVRLSRDLAENYRGEFLIKDDSPEYHAMIKMYEPKPVKRVRRLKAIDPHIQKRG